MPLPIILYKPAGGSVYNTLDPQQDGVVSMPYGTFSPSEIIPGVIGSPLGPFQDPELNRTNVDEVTAQDWNNFISKIEFERIRSNADEFDIPTIATGQLVDNETYMSIRDFLVNISTTSKFTNAPLFDNGFGFVRIDEQYILDSPTSQTINSSTGRIGDPPAKIPQLRVITQRSNSPALSVRTPAKGTVITAASVNRILADLNRFIGGCTCNCNYCTCNCNYSCTCNCNYSDMRLKTNILFSHMFEDLSIYKFSYKWDTTKTYLGIMAQHLIGTKYENAVIKDKKGMYVVDYSKLPIEMKEV